MRATIALWAVSIVGCHTGAAQGVQRTYDLDRPARTMVLPSHLREISALTDMEDRTVAALQDEQGVIYFIDPWAERITDSVRFTGRGDFEGLTRVGNSLYALRSDGLVHVLDRRGNTYALVDSFRMNVPNKDLESIGYDERAQLLLIAAKDPLKGGPDVRDHRYVYGYDLRTRSQLPRPVLDLRVGSIIAQAERQGTRLPRKKKKDGRKEEPIAFKLRPSSLAVEPRTDHYWMLSAADHALLVIDRSGRLVELVLLDPAVHPKAEGITFLSDGSLLISNEGRGGPARLHYYPPR